MGYAFMALTAYLMAGIHAVAITGVGVPITLNPQLITQTLIPLAVITSILVASRCTQ
ncbi:hypothetical protein [Vulcanisaeta sp. JCM 16161]|uniref:hypothetical protein n=1 Tax=Vulcanisaeta sp. JCM 16161 TaxID=1295372 RepID=UPI001FB2C298|nr:hypothetical protein [Vulcanisaeta sp. JCM 16161]